MEYKKVKVETVKLSDNSGMILELLYFKNAQKKKFLLNHTQLDLPIYL